MKLFSAVLLGSMTCVFASAALGESTDLKCSYAYMSMPMAEVSFTVFDDGRLSDMAKVISHGKTHYEALTAETVGAGEFTHAWLSKDVKDNNIELIVYNEAQSKGDSKLVNPNVPFKKEMWGTCIKQPSGL